MYRGITVKMPVGAQGFTGTRNPSQAGPGHLVYTDGAELDGGIIRKEGGAELFADLGGAGDDPIVSGISWDPGGGAFDYVFRADGDLLKGSGGTFGTTLATGLSDARLPPPLFVPCGGEAVGGNRKLHMFSGTNQVQEVIGTANTAQDITDPPADWAASFPTFGVLHNFRMWGGGNSSDPHRLYYSTLTDHGDYTGAGSGTISIFSGEGEGIVGAISFRGALVVFKYPLGVYIVDAQSATPAEWSVKRLSRAVGGLNAHTIVQIENDVLYMDHAGNIHILSATQEFGDVNTSNISRIANLSPFMRSDINRGILRQAVGCWYPDKRQAWFAVPRLGSDDNDLRLIMGFEQQNEQGGPALPRFFMSRRDIVLGLWLRSDADTIPRPVTSDNVGGIYLMDREALNKEGAPYTITFETANTDLSFAGEELATKMKAGQFLELVSEPRGDWDLTVEVFWDDVLSDILQFSMGGTGAAIGSFVLDTDTLGSDVVASKRQRISGSGRRIKLVCENSGLDQDVSLAEFYLGFSIMDERTRDA